MRIAPLTPIKAVFISSSHTRTHIIIFIRDNITINGVWVSENKIETNAFPPKQKICAIKLSLSLLITRTLHPITYYLVLVSRSPERLVVGVAPRRYLLPVPRLGAEKEGEKEEGWRPCSPSSGPS